MLELFNGDDPNLTIAVSQVRLCWLTQATGLLSFNIAQKLSGNLWNNLGTPVAGPATSSCVTEEVSIPSKFYRVIFLP